MADIKNNRICVCCSTEYRYCNSCSEDKTKPSWYSIYCSENCKKLFHATSSYFAKTASIEEIKVRFDDCDLSYKHKLKPKFIEAIDNVYNVETKTEILNEVTDAVEETIIPSETEELNPETEEIKENENAIIKEVKYGYKNKHKKKNVFE